MANPVGIFLTKFICCDSADNEEDTSWGYRIYDDFDSIFYDSYESLEEAVDALSRNCVLSTIARHSPRFLVGIEREGGILLDGIWVDIEDLRVEPENETCGTGTSQSPIA